MQNGSKKALICTIGDEILIGQILDTNSQWISEKLTLLGIEVGMTLSVPDRNKEIFSAIKLGMEEFDLTIITGGLGPTKDDITKKTLLEYFNDSLIENKENKL